MQIRVPKSGFGAKRDTGNFALRLRTLLSHGLKLDGTPRLVNNVLSIGAHIRHQRLHNTFGAGGGRHIWQAVTLSG